MTTATLVSRQLGRWTRWTGPRRSLEELVDQLMAAMFKVEEAETAEPSAARSIHEARRLRQAGDVDTALAVMGSVDASKATPREARWAFSEWTQLVRRRFGGDVMVYSQGTGPLRWFPTATGRWRWRRSWGCAGGPARSSRVAASGACGP